jgi:quercetin dioxygenase-like cupin family protein
MSIQAQRRPHPLDPLAAPAMTFALDAEIRQLHAEPDWSTGQNAKTLAKHDNLRVVLTVLDGGHHLPDHRTAGRISIQTIAGHLTVHAGTDTIDLPEGRLLVLDRDIPHDVEPLEASAFLLTIAWPGGHS